MVGNGASLVAECMPCKACRGARPLPTPQAGRERRFVGGFFSVGRVLSSRTAGTTVKADKHWQNFKNCCHSPTDVHYVPRALRFTA